MTRRPHVCTPNWLAANSQMPGLGLLALALTLVMIPRGSRSPRIPAVPNILSTWSVVQSSGMLVITPTGRPNTFTTILSKSVLRKRGEGLSPHINRAEGTANIKKHCLDRFQHDYFWSRDVILGSGSRLSIDPAAFLSSPFTKMMASKRERASDAMSPHRHKGVFSFRPWARSSCRNVPSPPSLTWVPASARSRTLALRWRR